VRELRGRAVAVTGAASGIGRETALAFGRRGAHLAVCDIEEAGLERVRRELEGLGCLTYSERVDVSRAEDVERFCDNAYSRFARVDVLVNNAGIAVGGPVERLSLDDWRRIVGVNLWGVIHGCHHFYPRMVEQGGGSIVNVASMAAFAPFPGFTAYACTKYGVLGLSESLRAEAARHGVFVSAVCPGVVNTPIYEGMEYRRAGGRPAREAGNMAKKAAERLGCSPSRVAEAVVEAVERRRGVVAVGRGAWTVDFLHRLSRGSFGLAMRLSWRVGSALLQR